MKKIVSSATMAFLTGIFFISCLSAPVPMRIISHHSEKSTARNTLVIFLPGNQSAPEDFEKEGFTKLLGQYLPAADTAAVDAPIGYYVKETLPDRLLEDVIKPARQKGYTRIWLVGVSMGGSGALWYLKKHTATIQGVFLMSPFLADRKIVDEIYAAGGLKQWRPAVTPDKKDYQRAQLLWLTKHVSYPGFPILAIGFGASDRFERSNRLVGALLPARNVFVIPGDHDWKTWREIFELFLKSGLMR